jgi:hypothetical protein
VGAIGAGVVPVGGAVGFVVFDLGMGADCPRLVEGSGAELGAG